MIWFHATNAMGFVFSQAQKIHSLSEELDEAKTSIRTLNKRNESDIVSDLVFVLFPRKAVIIFLQ